MKKRNIIIGLSLIFFIIITVLVVTNNTVSFDNKIYEGIISIRSNVLDLFFKTITECANPIPVIIIFTLLVILLKRNDEILLSVNILVTVSLNQLLKYIIQRPRPDHLRLIKQGGYSYPSGHSMIALCLYGTLIYLCFKRIKRKKLRNTLVILLTVLILLIGISRIYVGVHYPSDVLGGYFLTIVSITISTTMVNQYLRGKKKNDKDGNQ